MNSPEFLRQYQIFQNRCNNVENMSNKELIELSKDEAAFINQILFFNEELKQKDLILMSIRNLNSATKCRKVFSQIMENHLLLLEFTQKLKLSIDAKKQTNPNEKNVRLLNVFNNVLNIIENE